MNCHRQRNWNKLITDASSHAPCYSHGCHRKAITLMVWVWNRISHEALLWITFQTKEGYCPACRIHVTSGISSSDCTRFVVVPLGQVEGGSNVVLGEELSLKWRDKGIKRHTYRLMIIMFLLSFFVPAYQRLFYLFTEFHNYLFSFYQDCLFHVCMCACGCTHVDIRMPVTMVSPWVTGPQVIPELVTRESGVIKSLYDHWWISIWYIQQVKWQTWMATVWGQRCV